MVMGKEVEECLEVVVVVKEMAVHCYYCRKWSQKHHFVCRECKSPNRSFVCPTLPHCQSCHSIPHIPNCCNCSCRSDHMCIQV